MTEQAPPGDFSYHDPEGFQVTGIELAPIFIPWKSVVSFRYATDGNYAPPRAYLALTFNEADGAERTVPVWQDLQGFPTFFKLLEVRTQIK